MRCKSPLSLENDATRTILMGARPSRGGLSTVKSPRRTRHNARYETARMSLRGRSTRPRVATPTVADIKATGKSPRVMYPVATPPRAPDIETVSRAVTDPQCSFDPRALICGTEARARTGSNKY